MDLPMRDEVQECIGTSYRLFGTNCFHPINVYLTDHALKQLQLRMSKINAFGGTRASVGFAKRFRVCPGFKYFSVMGWAVEGFGSSRS